MEIEFLTDVILIESGINNCGIGLGQLRQGLFLSPDMAWKIQCSPKAHSIWLFSGEHA